MKLTFNSFGNEKQKQAYRYWADSTTGDIAYGGSKGSGKSYLGASLIFGDAFLYPGTHYFIARKKLNDLRKFTVPTIHEVLNNFGIGKERYNFNEKDSIFTIYHQPGPKGENMDSRVFLLEAKWMPSDPLYMRLGSMQFTRGFIEEAGEFSEAAKNNLHASIGRWKNDEYNLPGKLLQTCNPSKNYLYRDYYKANKENKLPEWRKFIQALPQDNKKLAAGYLENLNRILDKNQKERLLKGNWEYDDDPATLILYEAIINAFNNSELFQSKPQRYITADIARFGSDKFIAIAWEGWKALKILIIPKCKVTEAAAKIRQLKAEFQVPLLNIIVDEDGVGGGVVDILGCRGFVANSRAIVNKDAKKNDRNDKNVAGIDKEENFDMLKSQCYFKLAEIFEANGLDLSALARWQDEIIEELEQVKQKDVDSDLKKGVVPKDQVKELIGRSPDFSDTIMFRAWFDLFRVYKKPGSSLPKAAAKPYHGLAPDMLN